MPKQTLKILVDGGKASPSPPLGPALGQAGLNIGQVVGKINEKTKAFAGMKVPVSVEFDSVTKAFDIKIGTPPTSSLIKKELGRDKGSKGKDDDGGNITLDQIIKIAEMKRDSLLSKTFKDACLEVVGTCVSMNVKIDGKKPAEITQEIKEGKHDSKFK